MPQENQLNTLLHTAIGQFRTRENQDTALQHYNKALAALQLTHLPFYKDYRRLNDLAFELAKEASLNSAITTLLEESKTPLLDILSVGGSHTAFFNSISSTQSERLQLEEERKNEEAIDANGLNLIDIDEDLQKNEEVLNENIDAIRKRLSLSTIDALTLITLRKNLITTQEAIDKKLYYFVTEYNDSKGKGNTVFQTHAFEECREIQLLFSDQEAQDEEAKLVFRIADNDKIIKEQLLKSLKKYSPISEENYFLDTSNLPSVSTFPSSKTGFNKQVGAHFPHTKNHGLIAGPAPYKIQYAKEEQMILDDFLSLLFDNKVAEIIELGTVKDNEKRQDYKNAQSASFTTNFDDETQTLVVTCLCTKQSRAIRIHHIETPDQTGLNLNQTELQALTNAYLTQQKHYVYAHCSSGVGRTGAVRLLFAMLDAIEKDAQLKSQMESYIDLKAKHETVSDNILVALFKKQAELLDALRATRYCIETEQQFLANLDQTACVYQALKDHLTMRPTVVIPAEEVPTNKTIIFSPLSARTPCKLKLQPAHRPSEPTFDNDSSESDADRESNTSPLFETLKLTTPPPSSLTLQPLQGTPTQDNRGNSDNNLGSLSLSSHSFFNDSYKPAHKPAQQSAVIPQPPAPAQGVKTTRIRHVSDPTPPKSSPAFSRPGSSKLRYLFPPAVTAQPSMVIPTKPTAPSTSRPKQ